MAIISKNQRNPILGDLGSRDWVQWHCSMPCHCQNCHKWHSLSTTVQLEKEASRSHPTLPVSAKLLLYWLNPIRLPVPKSSPTDTKTNLRRIIKWACSSACSCTSQPLNIYHVCVVVVPHKQSNMQPSPTSACSSLSIIMLEEWQIINPTYHNYPTRRTLTTTHQMLGCWGYIPHLVLNPFMIMMFNNALRAPIPLWFPTSWQNLNE